MGKIKDLAPILVAAGIDRKDIKNACVPRKAAPAKAAAGIAPKRIQAAYKFIVEGKDDEAVSRLACVPYEIVWSIRDELDIMKLELAGVAPVEYDAVVELTEAEAKDEDKKPAK